MIKTLEIKMTDYVVIDVGGLGYKVYMSAIGMEKLGNIGDKVKVYTIGDFSKEICGGPHVKHTGELGRFKIKKEESSSSGIRRIKAVLIK